MNCPVCGNQDFAKALTLKDYFLTKECFTLQQCKQCSFQITDPQPAPEDVGRYYLSDDYLSHTAEKKDIISKIYKQARLVSLRFKFNIVRNLTKGSTLLDIGCGTGEFLAYCKDKGMKTTGVEPSARARNTAKGLHNLNVFERIDQLDKSSARFDCITMWHVLEHIHDINGTFQKVNQLLSPDGILIVALPNFNSWDAGYFKEYWAGYDVPRHLYHFNERSFSMLAKKHNFQLIRIIPQKLDAYYVSMLSLRYRSGQLVSWLFPLIGFWSNIKAKSGSKEYSSRIYILQRGNA